MNKVFEKIIEKLEELHERYINQYGAVGGNPMAFSVKECMEIVKQEAAAYEECYKDCGDCEAYYKEKHHCPKFCKVITEAVKEIEENHNGWIPCSERLPDSDKNEYIVQKTNGITDILGFTKDAYKLSRYDFAEYKGKKKQLFYDYDSEYGYIEWECEAWQPLPQPYQPKGECKNVRNKVQRRNTKERRVFKNHISRGIA